MGGIANIFKRFIGIEDVQRDTNRREETFKDANGNISTALNSKHIPLPKDRFDLPNIKNNYALFNLFVKAFDMEKYVDDSGNIPTLASRQNVHQRVGIPGASEDDVSGYREGDFWIDITHGQRRVYVCLVDNTGNAEWTQVGGYTNSYVETQYNTFEFTNTKYIDFGSNDLGDTSFGSDIIIEFYFNLNSDGSFKTIATNRIDNVNYWALFTNAGTITFVFAIDGSNRYSFYTPAAFTVDNSFHHVIVHSNRVANKPIIYVDGVKYFSTLVQSQQSGDVSVGEITGSKNVYIGNNPFSPSLPLSADGATYRMYSTLNDAQAASLYVDGKSLYYDTLSDEIKNLCRVSVELSSNDDTASDETGNGYNGTKVGGIGPDGALQTFTSYVEPTQELQLLVDTTIAGDTASDTIRIPMVGTGDIDWGDGTQTLGATGTTEHTYSTGGQYTISIQNTITSINYSNSNDKDKLLEISNWGSMSWATMNSSFFGCSNMEITASDLPNLSGVTDMYATFNGCPGLTSLPLIDTSNVTDMTYTFGSCSGLTSFPLVDTSNVTTFLGTFWGCSGLTSFPTLNFSSATTLESCWRFCTGLTSFPLITIPNVTTLKYAWYNCSSLTSFPLIDTSSVTYLLGAWQDCSSLTAFPLISTSSVTYMRNAWLGCSGLTSFPLIDTSSADDINNTWSGCTSLTSFPTLNFSSMTNGSGMFSGVTLDTTSWSDLLIATEANNSNNSVSWSGGNSQYNASGQTARDLLTGSPRNWTITDGGLV